MGNALLIFERTIRPDCLQKSLQGTETRKISILPLTSHWNTIQEVKDICTSLNQPKIEIELLDSARLIDNEVSQLRTKVVKWSAALGNHKAWNKTLKEWFLTPRKEVSTWWFSLISEKNTFKTDLFLRIAQVHAIAAQLRSGKYEVCCVATDERHIYKIVKKICAPCRIAVKNVKGGGISEYSRKEIAKKYLGQMGLLGDIAYSLAILLRSYFRGRQARRIMGPFGRRKMQENSVVFVSYFPAVDKEAAKKGVFKNKYAEVLQAKLTQTQKPVIWLLMYVIIDGWSFRDALKLGKRFGDNGETLFFIEEFISIRVALNTIYAWVKQIISYVVLSRNVKAGVLSQNLSIPETDTLIYAIWRHSFVGKRGIEGIIYFELYKKVFQLFRQSSHCIYYAEMQAWEKALNAAARLKSENIKTIGFQHTVISANYFSYFHDSSEMVDTGQATCLPLPETLACNGDIPFEMMRKHDYPNLAKVEAIRQMYLNRYLKDGIFTKKEIPILLVAGSINRRETASLIYLLSSVFCGAQSFKIWLKGHPSMPFEEILDELKIDCSTCGYEIKNKPIYKLLQKASIVLAGTTTTSLEALAFDCDIIVPAFSDQMFMNPLIGFEEFYHKVYSPEEFEKTVINLIEQKKEKTVKSKQFLESYWCLDPELIRWSKLLSSGQVKM